jgi:hypothetical protein
LDEKQELLKSLETGREDFMMAVRNVPDEIAARTPEAGRWSILECVEHVAIAEEYMLAQMRTAKHSDAPAINSVREAAIRRRGADRSKPAKSPDIALPTGRFASLDDAIQHFLTHRTRTIQFVEQCDQNLRTMLTHHAFLGPVNCHEMVLLMVVHPQRHAKQIEEVRTIVRSQDVQ